MNTLRPDFQALLQEEATAQARVHAQRRARQRRRTLVGSGTFALAASAAAVFLAASPIGTPLSVTEAVAAAGDQLESNGVLHWVQQTDYAPGDSVKDAGAGRAVVEHWVDLRSEDSRTVQEVFLDGQAAERTEFGTSSGRLWSAPGGGIPIQYLPSSTEPESGPDDAAPIEDVADIKASLARGEQGLAELAEAPEENGEAVVTVTDRLSDDVVVKTWITRSDQPRVLRIATSIRSNGATVTQTATTTEWAVLPASETSLARVQPPE